MPWTPPFQPTELVARLWLTIQNIRSGLGLRGAKEHALGPLMCRVWKRLVRLHAEVERLVTAVREDRLRAPRAARQRVELRPTRSEEEASAAKAEDSPPTTPWEKLALPRGFGWLLRVVPEARQTGGQVQFWMNDPELPELLAKAPQLGRPLRSLCYMMGIRPPPALRPPPRPRRPRPARPRPARRQPRQVG
ncbi:MAG: hypothetical protein JOZ58_05875, partial [Acetobacteraceae bacterium]|nr:hypothetical protein [Acetobacteraceae bacterium]